MEKLLKALGEAPISAYKINCVEGETRELYFVLDKIETVRSTDTTEIVVTIYVDVDGKRGSSDFSYSPYMDEEELKKTIAEKVYAAKFALNPFYEIPGKTDEKPLKLHSNFENRSLDDIAEDVGKAIFEGNEYEGGYLSATEVFITKKHVRILNSRGVDVEETTYEGFIEVIPSYGGDHDEVETYNAITFSGFDRESISSKIKEAIELTKARYEAKPLKLDKKVKVIIEGEGVSNIASFFVSDLSYDMKYRKLNFHELGEVIQGEDIKGDRISIDLLNEYPHLSASCSLDEDGVILKPLTIIKDGVGIARFGSYRFGYYLGEKNPTGNLPIISLHPGKKSYEEMRKEPYLRCVKYSSFQIDRNSGYFGGEVRLGFYFDGEREIPVTGFSISGSLHKLQGSLVFSKETFADSTSDGLYGGVGFVGPKYIEVEGMDII